METLSIEMYKYDTNIIVKKDSYILNLKTELAKYDTLYEMYKTDFTDDYFLTCDIRKSYSYHACDIRLNKKYELNATDFIHCFVFILQGEIDKDKLKWFRKNKNGMKPVRIEKIIADGVIHFYLIVNVKQQELRKTECNICYNKNKLYYVEQPFKCIHNEVCSKCVNKIKNTSNCCPICRANFLNL